MFSKKDKWWDYIQVENSKITDDLISNFCLKIASFTSPMMKGEFIMGKNMIDITDLTDSQRELIKEMIAEFKRMNQK